MNNSTVIFPCKKVKCIPVEKCNTSDEGICIIVPVIIHHVCPKVYMLVIVEVYLNEKLYCRKIKKIYTGTEKRNKCDCGEQDNIIESLYIDEFKFYFVDICEPECIKIEVETQYLYDY